jgi:uncharacterized protein
LAGRHLTNSKSIVQNDDRATFELLQKAVASGNARAQVVLARCYADGRGTNKDAKVAFEWLLKAARQKHPDGMLYVGLCYTKARGCSRDESKAFLFSAQPLNRGVGLLNTS